MEDFDKLACSFCGKSSTDVKKLIAGPEVYICNECVTKCQHVLSSSSNQEIAVTKEFKKSPSPRLIKEFLDQYVIGQDYAKQVLSVAVYNHYKRLENPIVDGVEISKSNLLILGPTGSGKTHLAQTIARMLDVPFIIADATSLTEAGYVGEDVESIVGRLLVAANGDVSKAEKGIIFLDEIDKKKSGGGGTNSRDVSGEGVQQALLKLLEDSEVLVAPPGVKRMPSTELVKVKTKNILFIVSGAFVGIEKIVEKSLRKGESGVGFGAAGVIKNKFTHQDLLKNIEPEHLIQFGMIPELVGRLPIIAALHELDEEQLVQVLTEPKNSLVKQTVAMFRLDGIELTFEPEALKAVASIAKKRKTNGRALRSVLETRLMKTQFQLPDLRDAGIVGIVVSAATINNSDEPRFIFTENIQAI